MFCTKCGAQLAEGSRFCSSCGQAVANSPSQDPQPVQAAPVQEAPPQAAPAQTAPTGMTTAAEVENFYVHTLGMAPKYAIKYREGIQKLIDTLMPGEVILFATHAGVGDSNPKMSELAITDKRIIFAPTARRDTRIETYRISMLGGVRANPGMLLSTIIVQYTDGDRSVLKVDNKFRDIVVNQFNQAMYANF
jgi:hypothetical protein